MKTNFRGWSVETLDITQADREESGKLFKW
jgi:hypothetical protein